MILEVESCMFWNRNAGKNVYITTCTNEEEESVKDPSDKAMEKLEKSLGQVN